VLWYGASPDRRPDRNRLIGFAGHESFLYLELTALENVTFAARMQGIARPQQRAGELLSRLGLDRQLHKAAGRLSRGIGQRLSLARALVHDPPIVILDEPFSGLDASAAGWLEAWLAELSAERRAVLFTSHDCHQCGRVATRTLELHGGQLHPMVPPSAERLSRSA
jgi:ABC-type multidrug transport system ATPase subunit